MDGKGQTYKISPAHSHILPCRVGGFLSFPDRLLFYLLLVQSRSLLLCDHERLCVRFESKL